MATKKGRGDFVKWFSELNKKDVAIAGGKGASLAEMANNKFPVPPGFVITTDAYKEFVEGNGLQKHIVTILNETDIDNTRELQNASKKIRGLIESARMQPELKSAIEDSYDSLDVNKKSYGKASQDALDILKTGHEPPFVAVRSSATTEDLVSASFAGQQDSFLNIKGDQQLIEAVKKVFSSLFTPRAIYYRTKKGFAHDQAYLAVVVQTMVDADKSGVMFSKNPLKNDNNVIIEAVWGLGEGIVSGKISPDHYVLNQELEILDKKISEKKIALSRNSSGKTEEVKLTEERSRGDVLNNHELKVLTQYAQRLEEHYKKPQDIEFAIGDGEMFIVQSRPITTQATTEEKEVSGNVLISGSPASPGVSSGIVKIVYDLEDLDKVHKGNVLVTKMTSPDMVVTMQKASAIITDEGGATSHAAIVSREMGIPAVVGTKEATEKLKDGQLVTVDGFTGRVIEGEGEERKAEINEIVSTKTKIKVIVDLPDYAKRSAACGAKAIGLTRLEGLIASSGKHPVWYIKNEQLDKYIEVLNTGLKKILKPFEEIWIRTSDLRSDEYQNLEGAPEKEEINPMLGDHGIRFSLRNQEMFEAEIKAIKELADEYKDKKVGIMMPQIITLEELQESKKIIQKVGIPENVKVGIMVETPAAVQIINDLCEEGIQFISFGTNDLTQYTLAVDRNNENVQDIYNEMSPAVLNSLRYVIRRCKKYGVETSICGQAGSKPEMVKFLVENEIDSISVNADAAYDVSKIVSEVEGTPEKEEKTVESGVDVVKVFEKEKAKIEENFENAVKTEIKPKVSEEDMILEALEATPDRKNEYFPGIMQNRNENVPSLNEAIPITSEDFVPESKEEIVHLEANEPTEESLAELQEQESINTQETKNENMNEKKSSVEELQEEVFEESIEAVLKESAKKPNVVEEMQKGEKKEKDETLDIF